MSGIGAGSGVPGGVMGGMGSVNRNGAPLRQTLKSLAFESAAADSLDPHATTAAFDDYFEYRLTDPVTIRKNESALVPVLQTKLPVERVTLWSPSQPRPLRALWITNSSNLTLDRGSFSIVEDGNFGGEGLLDSIHPHERRLLSYAADTAVSVGTDYSHNTQRVLSFSIIKGVLRQQSSEISEVEYIVRNAAPDARTVILEQPILPGWTLDSDPRPTETTPTVYRFRVAAAPGESVRLHIGQRHIVEQHYRIVDNSDEQLTVILRNANPAFLQQLEPVFAAKRKVASLEGQIKSTQSQVDQIVTDQKRLRENLTALKGTTEERALAKRYTDELNQQEDKLSTLRGDLDSLHQQRQSAQQDLADKIENLNIEQKPA